MHFLSPRVGPECRVTTNEPLAYFLTWRTYGTWLPGDERGWVTDRTNVFGEPMHRADHRRLAQSEGLLGGRPVVFDDSQRRVVDAAIRRACSDRGWKVGALNVRTNHVHVVVGSSDSPPPRVMTYLKARSTKALADAGHPILKPWARAGSHRIVWNETALAAMVDYVLNRQ